MELNSFARIGKGVLTKSIGLQQNFKETYEAAPPKLNVEASCCSSCPIHQAKTLLNSLGFQTEFDDLDNQCHNCSQSVWDRQYKVRYINEKNMYGYQRTLKTTAIKLLLVYHFLQPDALGLVKNIKIKELAQLLDCSVATITASNIILAEYEYCYISNSGIYDGAINIWLPEYKNYHKPAQEGGRGYLTLSKPILEELLEVEHINTLRLTIKGILEVDNASIFVSHGAESANTTYKQLRRFLPNYCKRNIIQKALEDAPSVLNVDLDSDSVTFNLKLGCRQQEVREKMQMDCKQELIEYIDTLNSLFVSASYDYNYEDRSLLLSMLNIDNRSSYKELILPLDVYDSLAAMCVQYSPVLVKQAISTVYNNYTNRGQTIENFGALIRTTIRNQSVFFKAS